MKATIVMRKKARSNGKYPLVLRVSHKGKARIITLQLEGKKSEWDSKASRFTPNHKFKDQNFSINRIEAKAKDIILKAEVDGEQLTLDDFVASFSNKVSSNSYELVHFIEQLIIDQKAIGKLGNAKAYKDTLNSLVSFAGDRIPFKEVTPLFLNNWELYLRKRGNNNGGIAFKMRELRSILNKAIERGYLQQTSYPFKKYKIAKLKHVPDKKALTSDEMRRIMELDLSNHPKLVEARDYFLFSFYTRGMNFVDMMLLKWTDIKDNKIIYKRSKTGTPFEIEILPPVSKLLDKQKKNKKTEYVFPILLKDGMSPMQIQNRRHKVLGRYNKKLSKIALLAGIDGKITSYAARHSFATILKNKGESVEMISELMGHQSPVITQAYLKSFPQKELDKAAKALLDI